MVAFGGTAPETAQAGPHSVAGWRLIRKIGSGGTATVYEAVDARGRPAAVKLMHGHLARDRAWSKRLRREARLLGSIDHPGLPRLIEVGDVRGKPYLVLELLEGCSLDERAEQRPLSLSDVLRHADAVLSVLSAVHAAGVVHRDLKPSNLFETTKGTLKVLDFGIAGPIADQERTSSVTNGLLGTPGYMSPEQARGRWERVDARSDLWALGALMFRLLTGEYVHPARTPNEQLGKAMVERARSLRDAAPEIPPEIAEVVDRALAYDREDRWQSAAEFREALAAAMDAASGTRPLSLRRRAGKSGPDITQQAEPTFTLPIRRTSALVWSILGLAALVLVLLVAGLR